MGKRGAGRRQEISGDGAGDRSANPSAGDREFQPSPIDIHVGGRIRLRRTLLQMSQERLGDALGLTFQQVQKYERGANRVGASRLFNLSRVLDVPVGFFFDDMPAAYGTGAAIGAGGGTMPAMAMGGFAEAQEGFGAPDDLFSRRETVELIRAYYRITEQPVRRRVLDLIRSMGPASA